MINKKEIPYYILILLLTALAGVLRFYHAFSLPFNYDELSAVSRTHYHSFTELMDNGVMTIYTEPAGIQVLLYYWTKIAGFSEFMVKLPFLIFGIAVVLYAFLTGRLWFNNTAGLLAASYIATLQYFIMWSQLARPMAPGLFLALAMAYHWTRIVFKPGKRYDLHWALYVLLASCCAYTHHFCLLFAAVAGFTGIFFVDKRYLMRYITAGIMIFVLYIPHLHIFFYQLSMKGIGDWLGAPRNNFLLTYLDYVFQFSPVAEIAAGAIVVYGIAYRIWTRTAPGRFFYIALIWFLIPFLAGFFYSRLVNPILQPSVLLFSFPFLLLALFGLLPELHWAIISPALLIICALNVYVLVYQRMHYDIFYRAPIEQNALLTDSVHRALGSKALTLMELDRDGKRNELYYMKKYNLGSSFFVVDSSMDMVSLRDYLQDHRQQFLSFATMAESNNERIPLLLSFYPYLVKQYDFYGGTFYLLSSKAGSYSSPFIFTSGNNFEQAAPAHWNNGNPAPVTDSVHCSGGRSFRMDSTREFGPTFTCKLSDMITGKNNLITVSVEVYPLASMDNVFIVSTIESNGKQVDWRASHVADYVMLGTKEKWVSAFHTIKLSDIYFAPENAVLKIYIWNKGKRNFFLDDFDVRTVKGNPIIYGLTEKF